MNNFTNIKTNYIVLLILLTFFSWTICDSPSAYQDQLIADLEAFKASKTSKRKNKQQPTQHTQRGDIVKYQVAYRNQGRDSAKQLLATLPVPKGMTYLPSDTCPSHPHASLDGEIFAPLPLIHWVRLAEGSLLQRQAPYSQYRFLQWHLGRLEAGSEAAVRARVRVNH